MLRRRAAASGGRDAGAVSTFVAISAAGLVAVIGISLDCTGRLRATEQADARAQEAARVVGQQLDQQAVLRGDGFVVQDQIDLARQAANAYLGPFGLRGDVVFNHDRTAVTVSISTTCPTALLSVINIDTLDVHGQGSATLVYGVTKPEKG